MAPKMQLFAILAVVAFLSHFLIMTSFADEGVATFYTKYVPSACLGHRQAGTRMIAAASDAFWNGGEACGKTYSVQCTGPSKESGRNDNPCTSDDPVVVTIVDYCPPGCQGTIDLSREAFASIADLDAGIISVTYNSI